MCKRSVVGLRCKEEQVVVLEIIDQTFIEELHGDVGVCRVRKVEMGIRTGDIVQRSGWIVESRPGDGAVHHRSICMRGDAE
jgi:hypothetical protein